MVLTDDNVATIVRAVEGGRAIHDNIAKFVRFQLSTNVGAILSLIGAPLLGMPVPFTAIQVLWVNLIMDGPPAMALGVDPPARDAMARPPRDPAARILDRTRLVAVALGGTVMGTATLGMLAWQRSVGSEAHALAMAFTTFVLLQLFNVFSSRNDHASALSFESLRNRPLLVAVAAVAGLQVLAVHLDVVQRIFGTADLAASDWLVCVAAASSVLWVDEIRKFVLRRHTGRAAARR
jgi:P-type Ca2+ transporter type 2C